VEENTSKTAAPGLGGGVADGGRLPQVLVIDDEPLLGQTLRLGLRDTLDVSVETSGEKGLARVLGSEPFELVLCDLSLPDKMGADIFAAISRYKPEMAARFVLMTGGAVGEQARAFVDSYSGPVLNKPFVLSEVERLVFGLLERLGDGLPVTRPA
jgi:CheY-like chemotaxis protein